MAESFLVSVLPGQTEHFLWPQLEELLTEPFEDGDLIWIAFSGPTVFGACLTYLDGDAMVKSIAGTRALEWLGALDEAVSDWARRSGAKRVVALGRKGWLRYFRRFGWTSENGRFEKEL